MKLYKANKDYIDELRKVDTKVLDNKDPKIRPYWFVAVELNGVEFAVPLSSPKKSKSTRFNGFTMIQIKKNSDQLGRLYFINMIPFHDSLFVSVDQLRSDYDQKYSNLLSDQQKELTKQEDAIKQTARNVYQARYDKKHRLNTMLIANACDFNKLIDKMREILNR